MLALTVTATLAAATALLPMRASADGMEGVPHKRIYHHHAYHPRTHFGYYWYQWGWRTGGTRYSWIGSSFGGVFPWTW
jgi:hypothetical protein